MKKLLLLTFLFGSLAYYNNSSAQCSINDLQIRLTKMNTTTCEVTFDLSWTQDINSGNKFAYVHMWTEAGYHTPAANWTNMYSNPSQYPKAPDLVNALSTIVVDDNHADSPLIGTIYHPDPTYTLAPIAGLTVTKIHLNNTLIERVTLHNITITLPSCNQTQSIWIDLWASQSQVGKEAHCAIQGQSIPVNQINTVGLLYCNTPMQFQVFIQNNGQALNGLTYKVYLDQPVTGVLDQADSLVFESTVLSLAANSVYTSPVTAYLPIGAGNDLTSRPLLIEVIAPGNHFSLVTRLENSCGPLPVKFSFFNAMKFKEKVQLNWQTSAEQNNAGFELQRKLPGEDFRNIAFVPSLALNGNSNSLLNYGYTDMDNLKGAGQVFYRIKQTDLDGKFIYSGTSMVSFNPEKRSLIIYPNPSTGIVNVLIPVGIGAVDILLNDMGGKELQKWNKVVANQFQMKVSNPGMYILTMVVRQTGEKMMNKLVVQ